MGISKSLAKAIGKAAKNKVVNASAQCKNSPNGKHHYILHREEASHAPVHYCKWCGRIH